MPVTVRRMISDLFHNRSRGVHGVGYVMAGAPAEQAELNSFYRVKQLATPITLTAGGPPNHYFQMDRAARPDANGFYLAFEDGHSTVATITRAHRIVVGGGFSGCLYSVYHAGAGVYKCVHTARPAGNLSDTFVDGIRAYAADQRWTLVHEIPTANDGVSGAGIGGCVTTLLATRISYTIHPRPAVQTVRLRQDNVGNSVARHRWITVTPP